ncbi:MAG TPA: hypothetical protein VLP43_07635 [Solirubrobacteraceae bacterium]|nr:hypothetical protein [Solirubrobacteraceae bacterium]
MRGPARAAVLVGAGVLVLSLFLPWSHQFSSGFLARYGTYPALQGTPRDPDAWQLFSFADVLLALLAATLGVAAGRGVSRAVRPWLLVALAGAAAFTLHAVAVPPTNGANIFDPARSTYTPPGASAGIGETVALIGLGVAAAGLTLMGRRVRA